jgi:hypothetical protein
MTLQKLMEGDTSVINPNQRISFSIHELDKVKDKINFSPKEYQRFFRATEDWQSQFLKSFFLKAIIIPEFCFRFGEHIPLNYLSEIMDGQQRATTLMRFLQNKISLPDDDILEFVDTINEDFTYDLRGKYFKELPFVVRQFFMDYELSSQVYMNLTPEEAGDRFVNVLNNQNGLNGQEKRQAISSAMSRFVQDKSRFKPYSVFETESDEKSMRWIANADHKTLDVDKTLAEIIYCIVSDNYKTKGVTGKCLDDFYRSQSKHFQNEFKTGHIDKVMKFVNQSMSNVPMAKEMIALKPFRNYCVMVSDLMKSNIKIDPVDFMNCYIQAIVNLKDVKLRAEGLSATPYELRMRGSGKEDTMTAFDLLWKEVSKVNYFSVQLDSKRTFTREQVKISYIKQDGICAICNTEMPEFGSEIEGDHVLLYKDGNPTTQDNCDAVHGSCNRRK